MIDALQTVSNFQLGSFSMNFSHVLSALFLLYNQASPCDGLMLCPGDREFRGQQCTVEI